MLSETKLRVFPCQSVLWFRLCLGVRAYQNVLKNFPPDCVDTPKVCRCTPFFLKIALYPGPSCAFASVLVYLYGD